MARSTKLIQTLKSLLKSKNIGYKSIATHLSLSESAVKRMFSQGNFSLARLDAICEILDMEMTDLAQLTEASEEKIEQLSLSNERALVLDMKLLLVAYAAVNHWRFDDILSRYNYNEPELIHYLVKLDQMKMIELQEGNRIKLLIANNFNWHSNGPIEQFFRKQVQTCFLDSTFTGDGALRLVKNGEVSLKSRIQLSDRLIALGEYFDELCQNDRSLNMQSKDGSTMVLALRKWEFLAFKQLERIK